MRRRLHSPPRVLTQCWPGMAWQRTGFPPDMIPVLFAIPRVAGWLAHWVELLDDPETRIYRPRLVRDLCLCPRGRSSRR